jgi:DNA-binding MarR family transcriptional regulator
MPNEKCPIPPEEPEGTAQRLMVSFIRLKRLHRLLHASEPIRPHEFSLLHAIRHFSCQTGESPRLGDLSDRLNVTPPTVTQQVNELERRGLVERRRSDADRRSVRVSLSLEGEALLARHREAVLAQFSAVCDRLGPERSETLVSLLDEVVGYLEAPR